MGSTSEWPRESIMMSAAGSGDKETWDAVLAQLERSMSKTKVMMVRSFV